MLTKSAKKKNVGTDFLYNPFVFLGLLFLFYKLSLTVISNQNIIIALPWLTISPFLLYFIFRHPKVGLYILVIYSFFMSFISRNLGIRFELYSQWGIYIDVLIVLTLFAMVFSGGRTIKWAVLKNKMILANLIFTIYIFLELLNPNAVSLEPWFIAFRGYVYPFFIPLLVFILLNQRKDFDVFISLLIGLMLFSALYSIWQSHIGLNGIDEIALSRMRGHMLFGKLRVFGMMNDAGINGAIHAFFGLFTLIIGIHEKSIMLKWYYLIVSILCLYVMGLSGTRGSIVLPFIGGLIYLCFSRNLIIIIFGGLSICMILYVLAFTKFGQSNYTINRMRTLFNPNDPSYQARMSARKRDSRKIHKFLMGHGVGTSGTTGKRFIGSRDQQITSTDGGFYQIQGELGNLGLLLYVLVYSYILGSIFWLLYKVKIPDALYYKTLALCCACMGLLATHYGNSTMNANPTQIIIPILISFAWISKTWLKGEEFPKFVSHF